MLSLCLLVHFRFAAWRKLHKFNTIPKIREVHSFIIVSMNESIKAPLALDNIKEQTEAKIFVCYIVESYLILNIKHTFILFCYELQFVIWLQIVLRILMPRGWLDMLFPRMEKTLNFPIPWRSFTQMWLGEAFITDASYRWWEGKQRLFSSILCCPFFKFVILDLSKFCPLFGFSFSLAVYLEILLN